MVDMAHFAGLVAGKVLTGDYDPVPHAHIVTTTTHKTLRGPRGGLVLCRHGARGVRRPRLPAGARRAAAPRHGGEGRGPGRSVATRRSATTPPRWSTTPASSPTAWWPRGVPVVTGGTDNHLVLVDVRPFGLNGRQAEAALRGRGHHDEPQRRARRDQRPLVHQRTAARHPRGHDARHGRRRDARDRRRCSPPCSTPRHPESSRPVPTRASRRSCSSASTTVSPTRARSRVADLLARHPLYPEIEL